MKILLIILLLVASVFPCPQSGSVSGQVTRNGNGLGNVMMILETETMLGQTYITRTSPFGYYQFDYVPSCGNFYSLTPVKKGVVFSPESYLFSFTEINQELQLNFSGVSE